MYPRTFFMQQLDKSETSLDCNSHSVLLVIVVFSGSAAFDACSPLLCVEVPHHLYLVIFTRVGWLVDCCLLTCSYCRAV